jgi:hypothetical protein
MLRHAPTATAIATVLLIGCGGGSSKSDGGGGLGGSGGGGTTGTAGGGGGSAGSGNTAGAAAPPTGSLVFQGLSALLDAGPPCASELGATGDRWCGFLANSTTVTDGTALFVVNVSKAAAGTSITCGVADDNCLKLTDNFWEDQFHLAFFQGDTLVYYDRPTATSPFTPVGWRPGMTAGRVLAVADANTDLWSCVPSTKGNAIWCLRDLPTAMQTDPNVLLSDLLAGHLDATATPPLVRIETVISINAADSVNLPHFQVGFPVPGLGDHRLVGAGGGIGPRGPEGPDDGQRRQPRHRRQRRQQLARLARRMRWYWLSAVSETNGAGTLQTAPFPAGTSPVTIGTNVGQYAQPSATSLLTVDSAKAMKVFADQVGAPTTGTSLDTGVLGFISVSPAGHPAYVKMTRTSSATGELTGIDLWVKKFDGTDACTLTPTANAFPSNFGFTPSSTGATWIQTTLTSGDAQYTRFSDCMKMPVANNVVFTRSIGDRAVLYLDGFDDITGTATVTARKLDAAHGLTADPASVVSGQVGTLMVASSTTTDMLIYTVNGGGNADGVYVRGFGP